MVGTMNFRIRWEWVKSCCDGGICSLGHRYYILGGAFNFGYRVRDEDSTNLRELCMCKMSADLELVFTALYFFGGGTTGSFFYSFLEEGAKSL
jgi:hypothetical protein